MKDILSWEDFIESFRGRRFLQRLGEIKNRIDDLRLFDYYIILPENYHKKGKNIEHVINDISKVIEKEEIPSEDYVEFIFYLGNFLNEKEWEMRKDKMFKKLRR